MPPYDHPPFIYNLTLGHPPYFSATAQFVKEEYDPDIQIFITAVPEIVHELHFFTRAWTMPRQGRVSRITNDRQGTGFHVRVPTAWGAQEKLHREIKVVQPAAYFLTTVGNLVYWLSRKLEEDRIKRDLQKKYGPKPPSP